jgi:hypothetical protein
VSLRRLPRERAPRDCTWVRPCMGAWCCASSRLPGVGGSAGTRGGICIFPIKAESDDQQYLERELLGRVRHIWWDEGARAPAFEGTHETACHYVNKGFRAYAWGGWVGHALKAFPGMTISLALSHSERVSHIGKREASRTGKRNTQEVRAPGSRDIVWPSAAGLARTRKPSSRG